MLMRLIPFAAVTVFCGMTLWQIVDPPSPKLIYNTSPSAPVGWYSLNTEGAITRDAMIAAFAPAEARNLADARGYLPDNIPLIKTVWAIGGDRVCSTNGVRAGRFGAQTSSDQRLFHPSCKRSFPYLYRCADFMGQSLFRASKA